MALAVAFVLLRALGRTAPPDDAPADFDRRVYRDQLREVERDRARGTIPAEEAERLRAEVARRLLEAGRTPSPDAAPPSRAPGAGVATSAAAAVALVVAAAFAGYAVIGRPGRADAPIEARIAAAEAARAARPSQAEMEAAAPAPAPGPVDPDFTALMTKLREKLKDRPDDLTGQTLLARNEANLGNFAAAATAQQDVIRIKGRQATDADRLSLASLMIQGAGGRVSPEAERLLRAVVTADPTNPAGLFFLGIDNMQVGRYDLAFRDWRQLLETGGTAPDPWREEVRGRIGELADLAGVRYEVPPAPAALAGPDAAAVAGAAALTPEARTTMIRGMVDGLSERLASQGGTAAEWAQLLRALGVLGETDRARAIWGEAKATFAAMPGDLAQVEAAARAAGVAE